MSCDTNKVTVLGDVDHHWRGRHRRDHDDHEVGLKDLIEAHREGESTRDIIVAVKDAGAMNVRETLEAKSAVLAAIAGIGEKVQESKHALAVQILETKCEAVATSERLAREQLRDLLSVCGPRRRGCGDHD